MSKTHHKQWRPLVSVSDFSEGSGSHGTSMRDDVLELLLVHIVHAFMALGPGLQRPY